MYKIIAFCLFVGGLIFGWAVDIQLSVPEKITKAFPPSSEVKIAFENLESLAQENRMPPGLFKSRYSEKLNIKALSCSKNLNLGRFDSIKKIKKLAVDTNCLALEDNKLLLYLGMSQVGIQISRPALRAQFKFGGKTLIQQPSNWATSSATFSSKSGVAILANGNISGDFISYDIKKSAKISNLESIIGADLTKISLSPNGRVVAVPRNRSEVSETIFLDTETGRIITRLDESIGVRVWLPELSAALMKQSSNNTLLLADFKNGKTEPYELDSKAQNWATPIDDSSARALVGTNKVFQLVQFERVSSGIKSTSIKDFYPKSNNFNVYNEPILMLNSQVAIFYFNDFLLYDLGTGKETPIETHSFLVNGYKYKKLNEEMLLVNASSSINLGEFVVFNIKDKTVSHIKDISVVGGELSTLNGRNGFLLKESNHLWIGEHLDTDQTKTLAELLADKNAKDTIEKIKHDKEVELFGTQIYLDSPPPPSLPQSISAYGKSLQTESSGKIPLIKSDFLLNKTQANTRYEFIGVKASANPESKEIQVTIQKSDRPLLLFLSSCNTVKWKITKQPGSRLIGVFQQIKYVGQPFSYVDLDNTEYSTQISTRFNYCAYERNSPEYKALELEILEKDGKKIEKFQGAESGVAFSVGN